MKTYLVVLVVLTLTLAGQVSAQINEQAALPEGGTVGSVTGPPDSTVVPKIIPPPPSTVIPKTYSRPASPSPEWQTRNGTEKAAKRVLQGDFAQRGHRHRQPIKTIVREVVGHEKPYQEVKDWNPASVSFVEARDRQIRKDMNADDQQILEKANIYAKGLLDGSSKHAKDIAPNSNGPVADDSTKEDITTAAAPTIVQGEKGFPWWALWTLGLLALLALLVKFRRPIWQWFVNLFGPFIRNTASAQFRRRLLPRSTIDSREDKKRGPCWEVQKAVKDLDGPNPVWQWAPKGGKLKNNHTPGGRLRFIVSISNRSTREIPTTPGMTVTDTLRLGNYAIVPGSGRVYVGNGGPDSIPIGPMSDAFLDRLTSGEEVSLTEIIDTLPARTDKGIGRLNLIYEIDEIDPSTPPGGGGIPDNDGPLTSPGPYLLLHPLVPEPEIEIHPPPAPETEAPANPVVVSPAEGGADTRGIDTGELVLGPAEGPATEHEEVVIGPAEAETAGPATEPVTTESVSEPAVDPEAKADSVAQDRSIPDFA